ncbi:helix-turn-helix transcriptional regulator [Pseudomonas lutea]|uniref:helix-turn-helix transcriptional regulator n=1 Tax=Pseudomonas lutea TaxID=243924 RepID=UPI00068EEAD6|nr:LuxR C-terminal-related transcriptional regulator [Pseudomonas lutea]
MSIVIGNWQGMLGGVLAPRELEGVLHCANDCTVKEASKAMGISPETLKKRLESARFKLKVSSIRALVLEAFRRGLIAASCAPVNPDPQHDREQDHLGVFIA